MSQKLFFIACEPSGDAHAAHVIEELKKQRPGIELRGLGGPKMAAQGVSLLHDMTTFSALGFGDVIRQYFKYRQIFYKALREVAEFKPDALILVDSPAFNLRFAKKIKKQIPVLYYISPQIWAWGKRRIHTIKRTVSKMLVALPFEVDLYRKAKVPCEFVGHPLLDKIPKPTNRAALREKFNLKDNEKAIGLLPGSRAKEVHRILPPMLESARLMRKNIPESVFFVTHSPNVDEAIYRPILEKYKDLDIRFIHEGMYDLLAALDFALIASGTTTLESALIGTPFFLLYRTGWMTYFLGRQLIRVPYLGLVNLLANKRVVPEFIQRDIHPITIAHEAKVVLENRDLYQGMKREFEKIRKSLGEAGAGQKTAQAVLKFLEK